MNLLPGSRAPAADVLPRPGPAIAVGAPARRLVVAAAVLIGCYAVAGRAFAQIGVSSLNLYIGELLIVGMAVAGPTRATIGAALAGLRRPGPLHTLGWALAVFLAYGLFEAVRGVTADPSSALEAAKNLVFNYLPVFIYGGVAVAALHRGLMVTFARWLPWANAAFILVFRVALRDRVVHLPGSQMEGVTYGMACFVSLALMVCYDRPLWRRWYLLLANGFSLLYVQVRAWWVAAAVGLLLWAVLERKVRQLMGIALAGLVVLVVLAAADIRIPGPPDRGGEVTIQSLFGRAIAPFDPELAAELTPEAASFEGTTQWRETWWREIWHGVHERQDRALYGYGYGYELSGLVPYIPEVIRTPHNVFMYALGFGGWLGVGTFAVVQFVLARRLWEVYRDTSNPIGLIIWAMGFASANFENFFETPYMAVPYYFLLGVALAPASGELGAAAVRAAERRRR
jgi:hypothetical protein